jgi:hypothetical protein
MAVLRFRRTVYKSGGQQATDRVSYITRQPVRDLSAATQQVRYISEGREDCLFTRSKHLPAWADGKPHVFFRAAETYERANGIAFEEWKIALPQELSHRDNMALTHDLIDVIAGDALPITYAFHDPRTMDGHGQQPHLHLLLSSRRQDGLPRTAAQYFRRYNAQHPERGGAQKDPRFRQMGSVKAHRVLIADVLNLHLERAGCAERVHPDTLEQRGIAREPEPKLFPSESRAYREDGHVSPRMQEVLEVRAQRQQTRAEEQADARMYWEERKADLGLMSAMDGAVQLAVIGAARGQVRPSQRLPAAIAAADGRTPVREQLPTRQARHGELGREKDDGLWGDLVGEAEAHGQREREAGDVWGGVQAAEEERFFDALVGQVLAQARHEAGDVWDEAQWEQEMLDVGWAAVRAARDEGDAALAAGLREQQVREQTRAWQSLEQSIEALAAQLDRLGEASAGRGGVRIRLWERDQGMGF